MQWDVETTEASESIESCTLCAACEVVCPKDNEITTVTLEERRRLSNPSEAASEVFDASVVADKEVAIVAAKGVCIDALKDEASLIEADMVSFEAGRATIDEGVVKALFNAAREVVVLEGLLLKPLREILGGKSVISIGEYLLKKPAVKALLRPTDLYIIDARLYNLDYERVLHIYDDLKKNIGLAINLDLHRSAISTGRGSLSEDGINIEAQARWILEGRSFERIVVENPLDADVFRKLTDAPVVSLMELV